MKKIDIKKVYDLGIKYQKNNNFKEAIFSYNKILKVDPNHLNSILNLGKILIILKKFDLAKNLLKEAIKINPNQAEIYFRLGIAFYNLNKHHEAINCFEKVIRLNPDTAEAYLYLGIALYDLDKYNKETEVLFDRALTIKPKMPQALMALGKLLFKNKKFELALKNFDLCNSEESRTYALSALYALGRIDDTYQRIEKYSELDDENLGVAAFSSFISSKQKKDTAHKFCKNPIDFIHHTNIKSHLENSSLFISEVIEELQSTEIFWEPKGKTTQKGFQSGSVLLEKNTGKLSDLKKIITSVIDLYYLKFKNKNCTFIKKWPSGKNFSRWHVVLKKQGYQEPHYHPSGWLSGVIYLKVVPPLEKNEGAIEFSLNGEEYFDENSPKIIHQPKVGDIILFPSSLHHRTIPFTTDMDRIIYSFDLMPDKKK